MFKLVLEKAEEPVDQIANICWIIEKAKEFQKNIYFCFIDYAKAFDCVDHNKLWKTFTDCFNCLPIAAIVDEKIFCCHGGEHSSGRVNAWEG